MHIDIPMIQHKSSPSNFPSLPPSSSSFNLNHPISVPCTGPLRTSCSTPSCSRHSETSGRPETVDGTEQKRATGSLHNLVFGHVPSQSEVESAINALLNFIIGESSSGSALKCLQQKLDCFDPRQLLSHGYGRVCDAFRLLQTDPAIKRLVLSLATDKAVWDAVMKNELVQLLRGSLYTVDCKRPQCSNEEPDLAASILRWILDATKAKVLELIEKFLWLVNDVFQPPKGAKPKNGNKEETEDKVRSSLLLSIVILFIVVLARAQNA